MRTFEVFIKPVGGNKKDEKSILIEANNKEDAHAKAKNNYGEFIVLKKLTKVFK